MSFRGTPGVALDDAWCQAALPTFAVSILRDS